NKKRLLIIKKFKYFFMKILQRLQTRRGFTLIEILLVVAAISILAGIVILAINPTKQLGDTRNAQRRADVTTILNAVYQYALDNNGTIPSSITTTQTEVCKTTGSACSGLADLGVLTTNEKYIVSMPSDPSGATTNGAGYEILRTGNNRVTVVAPHAESGQIISVSR
ncbi:MAG: type II secretion system protein, partial [Candidatus Vogelbacteria bacterium]|nr:type II secretion system protein [Candidatus Vogelbacteria bacterium]